MDVVTTPHLMVEIEPNVAKRTGQIDLLHLPASAAVFSRQRGPFWQLLSLLLLLPRPRTPALSGLND